MNHSEAEIIREVLGQLRKPGLMRIRQHIQQELPLLLNGDVQNEGLYCPLAMSLPQERRDKLGSMSLPTLLERENSTPFFHINKKSGCRRFWYHTALTNTTEQDILDVVDNILDRRHAESLQRTDISCV